MGYENRSLRPARKNNCPILPICPRVSYRAQNDKHSDLFRVVRKIRQWLLLRILTAISLSPSPKKENDNERLAFDELRDSFVPSL